MNEFENKLILRDEEYHNSMFPQIPNFRKNGSAFILTGGCNDDILVNSFTTGKEIRQGRYTRLVEISTLPYMREIRFNACAREQAYSFDVYVKAVIQVKDPITFYQNKNIDVDAYFDKLFSIDVKQITRKYSILDYNGLDQELTHKLSSYNTVDSATGFSYQISVVDAEPGKEAQEYVRRASEQELEAVLRNKAMGLAEGLILDYRKAVMTEVAEGKLTVEQAILKIDAYNEERFEKGMVRTDRMRDRGYMNEKQAKEYLLPGTKAIEQDCLAQSPEADSSEDEVLNQFYSGN